MKNRIKISVDGKSFTLVGEETEAHMQAVAAYIHKKIGEIRTNAAAVKLDTSLAYVLAALNVADDYFKEKDKNAELEGRNLGLRARLEELTSQLDKTKAELDEAKAELVELTDDQWQETAGQLVLNQKEETVSRGDEEDQKLPPADLKVADLNSTDSNAMSLKGGQTGKNAAKKSKKDKYRRR